MKVVLMTEAGIFSRSAISSFEIARESERKEKRRDDVHEEDPHDGRAWKDHGVADVWPVGGSELVRVSSPQVLATTPATSSKGMRKREEARGQDRQHERNQHNCTHAQHHQPGLGDSRGEFGPRFHPAIECSTYKMSAVYSLYR